MVAAIRLPAPRLCQCSAADPAPDPIWSVALPLPLPRLFDYRPVRVRRRRRPMSAVGCGCRSVPASWSAWSPRWARPRPGRPSLKAGERLDPAPLFHGELLDSLRWLARYTHAPLGEVFATALPAPLRQGEPLADTHALGLAADRGRRTPRWRGCAASRGGWPTCCERRPLDEDTLADRLEDWRAAARALAKRALVERIPVPAAGRASRRGADAADQARRNARRRSTRNSRPPSTPCWPRATASHRSCSTASPAAARPRSTCTRSPTAWRAAGRRWCWCRRSASPRRR